MRKLLYIIILLTLFKLCHAQNIDSLWKVYNNKTLSDTNRMKAIIAIASADRENNPDSAEILANIGLAYAEKYNKPAHKVNAILTLGCGACNKSNYPKAMAYFLEALKIAETIKSKQNVERCYMNIGNIYFAQINYAKALAYYEKALKIAEEINDKEKKSDCYTNIGNVYIEQTDYDKALAYHLKSLTICREMNDRYGVGFCYGNIALVYNHQLNYAKALENYLNSLTIFKEFKDKSGVAYCYTSIGERYISLGDVNTAIKYLDSSLTLGKEIKDINTQRYSYQDLAAAYAKKGNYKAAYEYHVKFKQLTDSIFNADNSKQLGDMKTKFEVEKKEAELKIKSDAEQEKLKAIASEEGKRQQVIIAAVAGVLVIVVIFSLFLYKRFKVTERQKTIIEKQKQRVDEAYDLLHEKNKEVMDSIRYAKRIQTALITSERYIANSLNRLIKNN